MTASSHLRLLTEAEYEPTPVHPSVAPLPEPNLVAYRYVGVTAKGDIATGHWVTTDLPRVLAWQCRGGWWRRVNVYLAADKVATIFTVDGEQHWVET